jgi:hypothetical protein
VTLHVDIGGEGRYPGALNVNPFALTSTTGEPGRPIPDLVIGRGEQLPIASGVVDVVSVENAPLRPGAAEEIARGLKPGGLVRLLHPADYAVGQGIHDAVAGALGGSGAVRIRQVAQDNGSVLTILRRGVDLLR